MKASEREIRGENYPGATFDEDGTIVESGRMQRLPEVVPRVIDSPVEDVQQLLIQVRQRLEVLGDQKRTSKEEEEYQELLTLFQSPELVQAREERDRLETVRRAATLDQVGDFTLEERRSA